VIAKIASRFNLIALSFQTGGGMPLDPKRACKAHCMSIHNIATLSNFHSSHHHCITNRTETAPEQGNADKYVKFVAQRDHVLALIDLLVEPSLLYGSQKIQLHCNTEEIV